MECRTGGDLDDYLYLDPKLLKGGDIVPKNRAPFQDAVVFIVGGGNYIEYQNLVDFIKVSGRKGMIPSGFTWNSNRTFFIFQQKQSSNTTKRIIYGASTLNNAKQFLRQLTLLGQEIKDV